MIEISLGEERVQVDLRYRKGQRSISFRLRENGILSVQGPHSLRLRQVEEYLQNNQDWLRKARQRLCQSAKIINDQPLSQLRAKTNLLVRQKLAGFCPIYQIRMPTVAVSTARSRWGCCNRHGVLSFNYRLCLLPDELVDYVVVHELCHLLEFNHSKEFWNKVGRTIADYRQRRQALRKTLVVNA